MDLVHQLRSRADQFSPTEKRIADACLDDIAFAAAATIDQLAGRAGVSRSALSRFAKTVGCGDIRELRARLAQAGAIGTRFFREPGPMDADDASPALAMEHVAALPECDAVPGMVNPGGAISGGPDGGGPDGGGPSGDGPGGDGPGGDGPGGGHPSGGSPGARGPGDHGPGGGSTGGPASDDVPGADARPGGATSALLGGILRDIERTLRRHAQAFDAASLRAAVDLLARAPMIYAYGMGGASTIASLELQYRLVRLGRPVAAYHDPVLMRVASASLDAGQAVVALSLSGITPELLDAVRVAKRYGARVLAFAPAASPLSALADVALPIVVDETDFIYKPTAARYGVLLMIDLLVTELALHAARDSRERLRRVKLALDDYRHGDARLPLGD